MDSSQQDEKERLRFLAKAEANAIRNQRFRDSRTRTMGLDVPALDAQVAEKKRLKELEREVNIYERKRNEELDVLLEKINQEEKQMRRQYMGNIKSDWEAHMEEKKHQASIVYPVKGTFRKFDGEDDTRGDRQRLQHVQIKRWADEEVAERQYRTAVAQKDALYEAEMNRVYDDARLENEIMEKDMRRDMLRNVMLENQQSAEMKKTKKAQDRLIEFAPTKPLAITDERIDLAMDEFGHIIQKDMFKGYTQKQKNKIRLENEQIMEHNRQLKAEDNQDDAD